MASALLERFEMCKKMDEVVGEKASNQSLTEGLSNHYTHFKVL